MIKIIDTIFDFLVDHSMWVVIGAIILGVLAFIGLVINEKDCTRHEKRTMVTMIPVGNGIMVPLIQKIDVCVEWSREKG